MHYKKFEKFREMIMNGNKYSKKCKKDRKNCSTKWKFSMLIDQRKSSIKTYVVAIE